MLSDKAVNKLFAIFFAAVIFFGPQPVYADTTTSSVSALTPQKITIRGVPGIWLPSVQMFKLVSKFDQQEKVIDAQEALISVEEKQIETSSITIGTLNGLVIDTNLEANAYKELATEQTKQIDHLEEWYRRPEFLILSGIILGIVGTGGTMLYIQHH